MNEEQLESLCLDWFSEGGWDVLHGPDIAPDSDNPLRNDYAQVLLNGQLRAAFETINKHLRIPTTKVKSAKRLSRPI